MNTELVAIPMVLSKQRIAGLLCCAFEGGTDYWLEISPDEKLIQALGPKLEMWSDPNGQYWHWSQRVPLTEGLELELRDTEDGGKQYFLDWDGIQRGLRIMADKYPRHFGNFINDDYDAETGDVFVQCCLFGDVQYG